MARDGVQRPRNPRGSGSALGEDIVAAAMDTVDARGPLDLTLRGLARTVGISAPAIYAHFTDMDAVLLAVAERSFADLAAHLRAAADAATPAARLRAVCSAYLDYAVMWPGRYLVMFGGQWDATAAAARGAVEHDSVDQLGHNALTVFVDAVINSAPSLAEPEAFSRAVIVWVALHGYAHQRLVARAFSWPPDIVDRVVDVAAAAGRTQRQSS